LTPEKTLLDVAEVAWVQVQLVDGGGIGIWPGHGPLLAETIAAPLRYADRSGEHTLELDAGILEISREGVTILSSGLATEARESLSSVEQEAETVGLSRLTRFLLAALDDSLRATHEERW
jgi:F0F1-type ATP synthase epsilon subunit